MNFSPGQQNRIVHIEFSGAEIKVLNPDQIQGTLPSVRGRPQRGGTQERPR